MPEQLKKILFNTYNNIFVLSGLLILLFAGALYLLLGRGAADALTEQMLHRQQVASRAGKGSIVSFIDLFGRSLVVVGDSLETSTAGTQTQTILFNFLGHWTNTPLEGLGLTDEKGIFRYSENKKNMSSVGVDVSDREYFKWGPTSKSGEYYVGEPIKSRTGGIEDQYIIPVATSIHDPEGKFKGVLVAGVLLSNLTDLYTSPLKISDKTRIYLIDNSGVILSAPVQKLVGVNYFDYMDKAGVVGSGETSKILRTALTSENEGKLDIALPDESKNGALTRYLIAYTPIAIGNEHWTLALATPASDALEYLVPFYFRDLGLAGLAFIAFLIITIRISKIKGYKEGVETEHKFHSDDPNPEYK